MSGVSGGMQFGDPAKTKVIKGSIDVTVSGTFGMKLDVPGTKKSDPVALFFFTERGGQRLFIEYEGIHIVGERVTLTVAYYPAKRTLVATSDEPYDPNAPKLRDQFRV